MAKFTGPPSLALFAFSWHAVEAWACSNSPGCELSSDCFLVNGSGISPLLGSSPAIPRECGGSSRRSNPARLSAFGRRRLIPNLEQVTCSEPTVTPINSAIFSRLVPCSTRFLICWIRSGVNFFCLPRVRTSVVGSAIRVIVVPSVHFLVPRVCATTAATPLPITELLVQSRNPRFYDFTRVLQPIGHWPKIPIGRTRTALPTSAIDLACGERLQGIYKESAVDRAFYL